MLTLELDVTEDQAWALAQLVKRFYYSDAEALAVDKTETQLMIDAIVELHKALEEKGYAPR